MRVNCDYSVISIGQPIVKSLDPYSRMDPIKGGLRFNRIERHVRRKHSSLFGLFISFEENKLL